MNIVFSKSAIADLQDIKAFYLEQGVPEIGKEFVATILERVETLVSSPKLGRVVPELADDSIREVLHPPFRIVYLSEKQTIKVVRVWRSERLLMLAD